MRVLGVTCSGPTAYFSLLDDGQLIETPPLRLALPEAEASERLLTFVQDLSRSLKELGVDAVALLRAERQAPGGPVNASALEHRTIIETLVRLAAVTAGISIHVVDRATARSRLDLARQGNLNTMLATAVPGTTGKYWGVGRGLAAIAARVVLSG